MVLLSKVLLSAALLYGITSTNAISDECSAENMEINATFFNLTQDIEAATSHFINHTSAIEILKPEAFSFPNASCFEKDYGGLPTLVCVFDYAPYVENYTQACEAAGHHAFVDDFKVVCQSLSNRRSELNYLNYTTCVSSTCDEKNITKFLEGSIEKDIEKIEEEVGVNCLLLHKVNHDLYMTSGGSSVIVGSAVLWSSVATAFILVSSLLLL